LERLFPLGVIWSLSGTLPPKKFDFDCFLPLFRKNVEKRALLENMEGLFLAVDEIVDGG